MDYNNVLRNMYKNLTKTNFTIGNLFVVNIMSFYNKTSYLLNSSRKNMKATKPRPLFILNLKPNERICCALSTFDVNYEYPIRFDYKKCKIKNIDCFGIQFYKKSVVFRKKTSSKKIRFKYPVALHHLNTLFEKDSLKYCGDCSIEYINKIKTKIDNVSKLYE